MRLTEDEILEMAKRNPHIKISYQAGCQAETVKQSEVEKKKHNKYRNQKVYLYNNNIAVYEKNEKLGEIVAVYDSIKEYKRHLELQLLQKAGAVTRLERQKELIIQEAFYDKFANQKIAKISYKADYSYMFDNQMVVEDVKGFDKNTKKHICTKDFLLKWKILKCKHPEIKFVIY